MGHDTLFRRTLRFVLLFAVLTNVVFLLAFAIVPPWWSSGWAYVVTAVMVLAALELAQYRFSLAGLGAFWAYSLFGVAVMNFIIKDALLTAATLPDVYPWSALPLTLVVVGSSLFGLLLLRVTGYSFLSTDDSPSSHPHNETSTNFARSGFIPPRLLTLLLLLVVLPAYGFYVGTDAGVGFALQSVTIGGLLFIWKWRWWWLPLQEFVQSDIV